MLKVSMQLSKQLTAISQPTHRYYDIKFVFSEMLNYVEALKTCSSNSEPFLMSDRASPYSNYTASSEQNAALTVLNGDDPEPR